MDRTHVQPQPLVAHPPRYTDLSFPPYRFVPGGPWPHPVKDPAGHMCDQSESDEPVLPPHRWSEQSCYLYGIDLFNHAYWWEAHEAWEHIWHNTDDAEQHAFTHGLIQLSAALLKWHLRKARGVRILLDRSRNNLRPIAESHGSYMGLDVTELLICVQRSNMDRLPNRISEPILLTPPMPRITY